MKELHPNMYELRKMTGYTAYHSQGYQGEGTIVAVLDSGIRLTHNEFDKDRIILGKNFASRGNSKGEKYDEYDVSDDGGHGTAVACCINGKTLGVAPKTKLLIVKVADDKNQLYPDDVVDALEYVRDWRGENGERVNAINLSTSFGYAWRGLKDVIKDLYEMDITVFCSAGNTGKRERKFPQVYDETIACGAIDYETKRASFSSYGDYVNICQIGRNIGVASHQSDDEYKIIDGTSFSAPISAGLAMLLAEKYKRLYNKLPSCEMLRELIHMNTKDLETLGFDDYTGYGFFTLQPLVSNKEFTIGSNIMSKNNESVAMEVSADIYGGDDGRTMLPVRYCNDDFAVLWLPHSKQVRIIS